MLDYDFDSRESRLVELRLHRPVDVNVRKEVFKDAWDLCFTNGVVFVAERGSSAIRFIELKGEVLFKPGRLKSRADLLSQLSRFRLSLEGTGPVLRKRLTTHLRSLAAQVENKEIVQINPPLSKLTSIHAASKNILLCADYEQRSIMQPELEYNGVAIIGRRLRQINYPNEVTSVESLYVLRKSAYLAATGAAGGLYGCNLDSVNVKRLLWNSPDSCKEIKRLYGYEGNIVFTEIKDHKGKTFNPLSATVETLLGTGHEGTVDGIEESCSFTQVHAICSL